MRQRIKSAPKGFKKKFFYCVLSIIVFFSAAAGSSSPVDAAGVTVALPSFSVTLNGTKIDNGYRQYPLIVYQDITYFPMTYYDCRFLGLETDWTQAGGLKIMKTGTRWDYKAYPSQMKNQSSYQASVAKLPITVNSETINNSQEPYPLLQFRNVTYFPLTWRFAVNSFGWTYDFNAASGLTIQAVAGTGSIAPSAQEAILPIINYTYDNDTNGSRFGGFTKLGNYYYFQGKDYAIYQALVSDPTQLKKVYQIPLAASYGMDYAIVKLYTENGKVFAQYHSGGGVMGHDTLLLLKENGTYEDISPAQYFNYHEFGDLTVLEDRRVPPEPNNLQIQHKYDENFQVIGDASLYYRLTESGNDLIGDDIFALAGVNGTSLKQSVYLYKVNTKTGKTTRLCDTIATNYDLSKDTIYFSGYDNQGLYQVSTAGGQAEQLSDAAINQIAVLDQTPFYITLYDGQLYQWGKSTALNPGSIATDIVGRDGYLYAYFSSGPNKMMIFDAKGNTIAKTIENVVDLFMENGKVVYVKNQ